MAALEAMMSVAAALEHVPRVHGPPAPAVAVPHLPPRSQETLGLHEAAVDHDERPLITMATLL